MSRKLLQLKYQGDFTAASHIVQEWLKKRPDNKELGVLTKYLTNSYIYVTALEMQLQEANLRMDNLIQTRDTALQTAEEYKQFYEQLQEKQL